MAPEPDAFAAQLRVDRGDRFRRLAPCWRFDFQHGDPRGLSAKGAAARRMTAFSFHLRDGSELLSVELPSAWCDSTVGRLQAFIAAKRGLEGWSCHLVTARGPADTLLVVREAS